MGRAPRRPRRPARPARRPQPSTTVLTAPTARWPPWSGTWPPASMPDRWPRDISQALEQRGPAGRERRGGGQADQSGGANALQQAAMTIANLRNRAARCFRPRRRSCRTILLAAGGHPRAQARRDQAPTTTTTTAPVATPPGPGLGKHHNGPGGLVASVSARRSGHDRAARRCMPRASSASPPAIQRRPQ